MDSDSDHSINLTSDFFATDGVAYEKLYGVRILGYLRGDDDASTRQLADSRWLVVELIETRAKSKSPTVRRAFGLRRLLSTTNVKAKVDEAKKKLDLRNNTEQGGLP